MNKVLYGKLICLYNHLILKIYEEHEIEIKDSVLLLYNKNNLIGMLQRYMCYNDLYCEWELSYFVSILCKSFTYNLNCLYLKEGKEYNLINDLLGFIFRTISERFKFKEYYNKKQINELYDCIADSIKDCSDMTIEKNMLN